MERYIGLDAHAQTCTFAVLNEHGKRLKTQVVETNGESLVEFIKLIPGRRHLCIEEGTSSQWLFEVLSPLTHVIAVVRGEKRRGNKNDEIDAVDLAERIRTGSLGNRIFKAPTSFTAIRDLARTYRMVTQDLCRTKNRIKSIYRSRGIPTAGRTDVYNPKRRTKTVKELKPATRYALELQWWELDRLEELKSAAEKAMVAEARKHRIYGVLQTAPGIGPVRASQLLAVVVSPRRFRTPRQFWSYCGLGIVMRSSADWVQSPDSGWARSEVKKTRGLNRNHNPICKSIFKDAATPVTTRLTSDPHFADYERLLVEGTKPTLAKLTIARKLAALVLAMWKNAEAYNPDKYRKRS